MSRIRHANTKLELLVRKYLFSQGYRYRLKTNLYGKPDIVFQNRKIAVFVNGCFWHHHKNCKLSYIPKSHTTFWSNKLAKNVERDKRVDKELKLKGWKIIRIWECDIETNFHKTIHQVIKKINQQRK